MLAAESDVITHLSLLLQVIVVFELSDGDFVSLNTESRLHIEQLQRLNRSINGSDIANRRPAMTNAPSPLVGCPRPSLVRGTARERWIFAG